jgi:heme/copper-type cytochrome/quinol oxidase subunit 3
MTAATTPVPKPSPALVTPSRVRGYSTAWWGMVVLIMTEATVFIILIASYFFLRAAAKQWPPPGVELPELRLSIPFSIVLWASSIPIFWAEEGIRHGNTARLRAGLLLSFLMGASFIAYTMKDFHDLHFGWRDNAYGSIFYTTVGLHALHVIIGLLMSLVVQAKAWQGKFSAERHTTAEVYFLYWHFVDAVWLFVFPTFFISPHLR